MDDMAMAGERERTVKVVSIMITTVVLAGYVAFGNSTVSQQLRQLVGLGDRRLPIVESNGEGSYKFLYTQLGSDQPVGFNPCRPIHYVVNPQGAPSDWERVVHASIEEVSARTGLEFEDDGTTDDRNFDDRVSGSGSAEPVIIAWADAGEVSGLADDVAGLGGPTYVELNGRRTFVTGSVVLDTDATDSFEGQVGGRSAETALMLHELGHLVGLDHVDDKNELMYPRAGAVTSYGPGDLTGLAELGAIPCR